MVSGLVNRTPLTRFLCLQLVYANDDFFSVQHALKVDMASAVIRSATVLLESSVMLCQAHVYVPMDGPAGVVTDVSKYHLDERRLALHIQGFQRNGD